MRESRRSAVAATILLLLGLLGCRPEQAPAPAPEAAAPREPSRWRFIDKTGKVAIEPAFMLTYGFAFSEGTAGVKDEQSRLGFIDKQGRVVIPFGFSDGTRFSEGLAGVLQNGMCGYIDTTGKLVIPLKYDSVSTFADGWGTVQRGGAWTFVNARGEEIPQLFSDTETFSEGLAAVALLPSEAGGGGSAASYGFIDKTGRMVVAPRYDEAEPFSEGLAAVKRKGAWGYIDRTGKMAVAPQFDAAGPFSEGLAQIRVGSKMGYVDRTGRMAIEPRFELDTQQEDPDEKVEMTGKFVAGLACVRYAVGPEANGGWGFIDRSGNFVIPPRYENADMFSEGLAAVQLGGKWGFVDPRGNLVIPARYDRIKRFSEGLALVEGGP